MTDKLLLTLLPLEFFATKIINLQLEIKWSVRLLSNNVQQKSFFCLIGQWKSDAFVKSP